MLSPNQYAMAHTDTPLPIRYVRLVVDSQEETVVVGFYIGEHEICRSQLSMDTWKSLVSSGLLERPQRIGLIGIEVDEGVQGLVVLVLFKDRDDEENDEPWRASLSLMKGEDEESVNATLVIIGRAFRPKSEREYQDDLHYESMAMLTKLIGGTGMQILTPEQIAIEELLASIE